jgi:hypothetical protein
MLDELTASTTPVKSSIVSTPPEGIPVRGVVVAVKMLACVKSTLTVVLFVVAIALLR